MEKRAARPSAAGGSRLRLFAALALLAAVVILAACLPTASDEELVQERCGTGCHTMAPIEASQKTEDEWRNTVYRMIDKGAELNDREAQRVIDYLSETYGSEP